MKTENIVIPEYQSENWNELKRKVESRFDSVFNQVKFDNLQKIDEYWYESVVHREYTDEEIKDTGIEDMDEAISELSGQELEIIWSTLFEAKDSYYAEKILKNAEKISKFGLTVIDCSDSEYYSTGVFIGVRSAGHDFYEAYWVELFLMMGWISYEFNEIHTGKTGKETSQKIQTQTQN